MSDPERPTARITIAGDRVTIVAPLDASRTLLLGAARRAHDMAKKHIADRAREDEAGRQMRGRADLYELHRQLGSWQRTLDAVIGDDPGDELLEAVRAWVREQPAWKLDDPRLGEDAVRQLRKWATEQLRYSTDADYDDDGAELVWTAAEASGTGEEKDAPG